MKAKGRYIILCGVLLLSLCLSACSGTASKAGAEPQGKAYFSYFDTVSYVYSYAGDSAEQFDDRSADVSAVLSKYHQLFDIYHEYPDVVNLCTVNRQAGSWVEVEDELVNFLIYAKELYELTDGEMNIMLGSVLKLWHECRSAAESDPTSAEIPSDEELKAAMEHTDFSLLEIDRDNLRVRITDPRASIDVGALGKGYATEKAAQLLEQQGAQGYVLNIGGNIRIIGTKPDGSGWLTGVKDPANPDGDFALRLRISNTSCVTSGVYERYFTVNGTKYHHIIDPDTLYPAQYFSSITVLTGDSGLADALSTALFCMSYEDGLKLVNTIGGVDVIWIYPDGGIQSTPGVSDIIEK